ncbi:ATP-dependent protease ATPase subunit HslU [bacterium]|nr:ATP-dependent protease ATPase subunit HslU [bacterium]
MSKYSVEELTPKRVVEELNRFIIGQDEAKKAVAVALRNRWRRSKIEDDFLRKEITPRNILMSGPTGVGKTEIARRLAEISNAPFLKVEATKFTEVGYVGRDVESMIKDLVKHAVNEKKRIETEIVYKKAESIAVDKILDLLNVPSPEKLPKDDADYEEKYKRQSDYRKKMADKLENGKLDDKKVSVPIKPSTPIPVFEVISGSGGIEEIDSMIKDMMSSIFPPNAPQQKGKKEKTMPVSEAFEYILQTEAEKLLDHEKIVREALEWVEEDGIIFIDEIDKIIASGSAHGPDVSREGVQRDILPIVEGCIVNTKYGPVKTDHILFIAAGAFHMNSPEDLIPELQGRFPIKAQLRSLTKKDFVRILSETENSLPVQYAELMRSENVTLSFTPSGIEEIAAIAFEENSTTQDIGARRLQSVMEILLEDISFTASEKSGSKIKIDKAYVNKWYKSARENEKLSNYII